MMTLTETRIIPNKTESNNCFIDIVSKKNNEEQRRTGHG